MKKMIKLSFILYLIGLFVLMFSGGRGQLFTNLSLVEYIQASSNLVPFETIRLYIQSIKDGSLNVDIPIKNLGGNVLLFLPMGIYVPLFIKSVNRIGKFVGFMTVLLFTLEVIQLVTRRGSFDIDDFMLNLIGALIGYGMWNTKLVQRLLQT
ncbi:vanZ like family protein [Exiguobacterium sp. SH31]|uniref:VanZ family protein n=1 Tax=unclassified Exiguobacterium TaxID=2644629 RepID=UPI0008D195B0|nr:MULTISPECIES: VanZ family protein [unclassified Exiguobacterium]OGX79441.1 vanZ like family protein [Exiguobacterium sp. SH31]TCI70464.1 VanZ family protein [Exiguobacterium sp. SH0S7]